MRLKAASNSTHFGATSPILDDLPTPPTKTTTYLKRTVTTPTDPPNYPTGTSTWDRSTTGTPPVEGKPGGPRKGYKTSPPSPPQSTTPTSSPVTGIDGTSKTEGDTSVEIRILTNMSIAANHTAATASGNIDVKAQVVAHINREADSGVWTEGLESNSLVFTNPLGNSMLQNMLRTIVQETSQAQEDRFNRKLQNQKLELDAKYAELDDKYKQHDALLEALRPYALAVRNRWMSANRTRLNSHNENDFDKKIREAVNSEVHSAEAYLDALLYQKGEREDVETYEATYGITWKDVYELGRSFSGLMAINYQGTLNYLKRSADKRDRERYQKNAEPTFEENYQSFLRLTGELLEIKRNGETSDRLKELEQRIDTLVSEFVPEYTSVVP